MAAKRKTPKNVTLDRRPGLYLKDVGVKGRGVFCTTDIPAGAVLEITPAIILNEKATDQIDKTVLVNYTFSTGNVSMRLRKKAAVKNPENASAVVMGMASFCNHCENPNAEIVWEEREGTLYYILQSTRRIPKGTEICTTYGATWFEERQGK